MVLDDFVPADHVCRVIDAFVEKLVMSELGFERALAAETGRPGYDPRGLLKLYLYGYLNQIHASRRLEAECRRNVELMWLLDACIRTIKASLSRKSDRRWRLRFSDSNPRPNPQFPLSCTTSAFLGSPRGFVSR